MNDLKVINTKTIWIIMKRYDGGIIEFTDAYWNEKEAREEAAEQLPKGFDCFNISIHTVELHGYMVDKK